ncbi:MAG: glycerophosphodiester phosphodiesterase [Sphaerobacteraceae bacterium]|nr:MAG: glycerophosphodiester phosphodiesterase [Sphaerobacteraceae bacterium]
MTIDHPLARITPLVTIAHRAGNSIELAQQATGAGVDIVEADLWLHSGRLEVRHSKTIGPLPLRWDRWWIRLYPPTCLDLETLLCELDPETTVMLDLKGRNPDLPGKLLEICRRVRPDQQILVCSQTWPMLEQLRHEPDVAVIYSIGNRRQLARAWTMLEGEGCDAVSIHSDLLNPDSIRKLLARVPAIITWPINDHARLERVRRLGVTGIISDSLELLDEVRTTMKRPGVQPRLVDAT